MNDPRPKTDQPKEKEQTVPSVVREPSTTVPTKPVVFGPQPKGPDSGGSTPHVADPKDPARLSTQAKP